MRDPKRIRKIIRDITWLWQDYPDMRLGQLLINFGGFTVGDNWNLEDDYILAKLDDSIASGILSYYP